MSTVIKLTDWIITTIESEFSRKIPIGSVLKAINNNPQLIDTYISEVQSAINAYNAGQHTGNYHSLPVTILDNTRHLLSIFEVPLPSYQHIISELMEDKKIYKQVISELTTSTYFKDVYELPDPLCVLHNLLILLYRTTMLSLYPELRSGGAQISSTIEEMACVLEINGDHTHLFQATKHWVKDWQGEGFSQILAKTISDL